MCHQFLTYKTAQMFHPSAPGILYFYVTTPHLIIIKE